MLCSKCHENIPQGKEMQIKGTIICKECALVVEKTNKEKIISRCGNCNRFIHKDELIHEGFRSNSKNFSKGFSIETRSSEKLFQCDECYQKWRSDVKKAKSLSGARFLLLGICIGFTSKLVLNLFFPETNKKLDNNKFLIIILFVIFFVVSFILEPVLNVDRYEIKRKKKAQKKQKQHHE